MKVQDVIDAYATEVITHRASAFLGHLSQPLRLLAPGAACRRQAA